MNGNGEEAYVALQKAIELNPGATLAYELLGFYYILVDKKKEAVDMLEEAVQIDPLSPGITHELGNAYIFAERYDDAIRQADKLLELDPKRRASIEMKAWATGMKGDWKAALPFFEEIHRLTNHPLKGLIGLGFAYGKLGQKEKAMECIRKLEQRQIEEPGSVIDADLAGVWYGLDDLDKTFYYINQCIDKRMGPVSYFLEYPAYKGIKDDPRYDEIRKRLGV
ncbi:MAG: tetratricopeptide repeat protein [Bacteroidota bacterium]